MDTWAANLGDRLLLVGDVEPEDPSLPVVLADWCTINSGRHAGAHVCKLLQALHLALERMVARGLTWAAILDDDVYVRVPNVDAALAARQTDRMGSLGCPNPNELKPRQCGNVMFAGGYRGGCGMFLNRLALEAIINTPEVGFVQKAAYFANKTTLSYGDLVVSCMLAAVNCSLEPLRGLNDGRKGMKPAAFKKLVHGQVPLLSVHHTGPDMMKFIHQQFALKQPGGR